MEQEPRQCPYCKKALKSRPYWKHVQEQHPKEYASDKGTWIQLYKDYAGAGMDKEICLRVVAELFNQPVEEIEAFLKENGAL